MLNAIINKIQSNQVKIITNSTWLGWNKSKTLKFQNKSDIKADYTVFSLGGGSWSVTGSNGLWTKNFIDKGIQVYPFSPANCAYKIQWSNEFIKKHEGSPLKNITITCDNETQKGEVVITQFGIEGNAIYGLSPVIQKNLNKKKDSEIYIDFKPTLSREDIIKKIKNSKEKNISSKLKKTLKLSVSQIDLLKSISNKNEYQSKEFISSKIKAYPLLITDTSPLDQAISTSGGIALSEIDENFELKKINNTFCIGEMLDWNAPTGGYLLQACFSMGVYLAKYLNNKNQI